ncbi:TPA: tetratricopeptide repeat protein [Candidatus Micrarchaeota archaeon]|nr:tetratricopeptide repeat protein [Candidatus Micrarchaeota archaeon]
MYIDPAFEKVLVFDKKFKAPEEVVKDQTFRDKLEKYREEATGGVGNWKINEIGVIRGQTNMEALYYFELGNIHLSNQQWQDALINFQTALQKGMDNSITHFNIGQAYHQLGDYKQAIKHLDYAVKMKNDESAYYYLLGRSYFLCGDYENAAANFRMELKHAPKDVQTMYDLGVSYNNAGRDALVKRDYDKALFFYAEAEHVLRAAIRAGPNEYSENAVILLKNAQEKKAEIEKLAK